MTLVEVNYKSKMPVLRGMRLDVVDKSGDQIVLVRSGRYFLDINIGRWLNNETAALILRGALRWEVCEVGSHASVKRFRSLDTLAQNCLAIGNTAFDPEDDLSLLALQGGDGAFAIAESDDDAGEAAQAELVQSSLDMGASQCVDLDERPTMLDLQNARP